MHLSAAARVRDAGCGIKALRFLGLVLKYTGIWSPKSALLNQTLERRPRNWTLKPSSRV